MTHIVFAPVKEAMLSKYPIIIFQHRDAQNYSQLLARNVKLFLVTYLYF